MTSVADEKISFGPEGAPAIEMTPELALPGQAACKVIESNLRRGRVIAEMRARVTELETLLASARAALAVEEDESNKEAVLYRILLDKWERIVDGKFAEARAAVEKAA